MWLNDYIQLLFPVDPNNMKIHEAQAIKYKHIPERLYRYRGTADYNLENLRNNVEWQSYPIEFNDPYDSMSKFSFDKHKNEIFIERMLEGNIEAMQKRNIKFSAEEMEKIKSSETAIIDFTKLIFLKDSKSIDNLDVFSSAIDDVFASALKDMSNEMKGFLRTGFLVICFSECWDNTLMWSHYAENHSGFCIEYDFKSLGPSSPRTRMLHPVIYSNKPLDVTEYFRDSLLGKKGHNIFHGLYTSITKADCWSYEREWRLIFPYGPDIDDSDRQLSMPKPTKVFLGAMMKKDKSDEVLEIAMKDRVPVDQMILASDCFELRSESVYQP